jgi:Flp pilus assembly protein TadD
VPADAEAHAALGFVYGELGRFDDAKREFEKAMEIDPNSPTAQQGLELVRQAKGQSGR